MNLVILAVELRILVDDVISHLLRYPSYMHLTYHSQFLGATSYSKYSYNCSKEDSAKSLMVRLRAC